MINNGLLNQNKNDANDFDLAQSLLKNKDYASAYLLFSKMNNNHDIAIKYNLALCLIKAKSYEQAISLLESALSLIKQSLAMKVDYDDNYKLLLKYSQVRYLQPISQDMTAVLPQLVKENILRLLINIYFRCNMFEKVLILSKGLEHFDNVSLILQQINGGKING